jgi:5'-nucleotidase
VYISQNVKNIRYATVADLEIVGGAIVSVAYNQVNLSDVEPDCRFVERVEVLKSSDKELNSVVGYATAAATKEGVANFTIASLAGYPYEDGFVPEVTFYHYGGIRLDGFAEGDVIRAEILNNDPFQSTIYIGTMTTQQMRDFILRKYNNGSAENPDKESHYPYFRSDAPYAIILGDEPAEVPDAVDVVFELEEGEYRVAMCNYIAENYIDSAIVARQLRPTDISVRSAMLRYMNSFGAEGYTPDNACRQSEVKR